MKIKQKLVSYFPFIIAMICFMVIIELLVYFGFIAEFIIPRPSNVIAFLWESDSSLITVHAAMTLWETFLGFGLALILGLILAIGMYIYPVFERICYPFTLLSQTIPTIALAPIFILWFGYSIWTKVAISFLIAFFPIVVGFYDGMRTSSKDAIDLFQSLGATKWQRLWHLSIPTALPQLMSSMKMAVIYALVGATIGEWMGASQGLGYYSRRMSGNLNSVGVFAAITLLSMMGIILFIIISYIERKLVSWDQEEV